MSDETTQTTGETEVEDDAAADKATSSEEASSAASVSDDDSTKPSSTLIVQTEEDLSDSKDVVISVDYKTSVSMRIDFAISQIQKYKTLSGIDDDADTLAASWIAYYKSLKEKSDSSDFEGGFNLAMPS